MNPDLLLAHFDRVSEAPDAIPRLRRFIMDLAVRGKLVEQNPQEASLPDLCNLGIADRPTKVADLPANWVRAKVGKLLNFQYGKALSQDVRQETGPVCVFGSNGVVGYCSEFLTEKPAIIIGRKGSAGALNLCNGPSWTTDVAYFVDAPSFF